MNFSFNFKSLSDQKRDAKRIEDAKSYTASVILNDIQNDARNTAILDMPREPIINIHKVARDIAAEQARIAARAKVKADIKSADIRKEQTLVKARTQEKLWKNAIKISEKTKADKIAFDIKAINDAKLKEDAKLWEIAKTKADKLTALDERSVAHINATALRKTKEIEARNAIIKEEAIFTARFSEHEVKRHQAAKIANEQLKESLLVEHKAKRAELAAQKDKHKSSHIEQMNVRNTDLESITAEADAMFASISAAAAGLFYY